MCVSYDFNDADGNWTTKGCMLMSVDNKDGVVTCQCDHLTNFGVLVVSHSVLLSSGSLACVYIKKSCGYRSHI